MNHWNATFLWAALLSLLLFLGSLVLVWIIIVCLPTDYLRRDPWASSRMLAGRPLLRGMLIVANALGLLFVALGIVMLLTPGQGVLSIFVGLTLLDFPGKRSLTHRLVARRRVLTAINRIRQKSHKPPLDPPY